MTGMLQKLFQHQAWADSALLQAVRAQEGAWDDQKLRSAMHHIVMVQRAFLSLFLERPFDMQQEMIAPQSLDDLDRLFQEAHGEELAFVSQLETTDLGRVLDMPWIPGCRPSLAEALMQVVMHSQNHRGQCLSRLRALGGTPPILDFIVWIKDNPAPARL